MMLWQPKRMFAQDATQTVSYSVVTGSQRNEYDNT